MTLGALFTCCLAALPLATVHGQALPPDSTELTILGIGVEADSVDVLRAMGKPDSIRVIANPKPPGADYRALYFRSVVVFMGPDGLKIAVELLRRGPQTRRGLQVGDRMERLVELYGQPATAEEGEWQYRIRAPYNQVLLVTMQLARVHSIFIGEWMDH